MLLFVTSGQWHNLIFYLDSIHICEILRFREASVLTDWKRKILLIRWSPYKLFPKFNLHCYVQRSVSRYMMNRTNTQKSLKSERTGNFPRGLTFYRLQKSEWQFTFINSCSTSHFHSTHRAAQIEHAEQ